MTTGTINMKQVEGVKRSDMYNIDPRIINIIPNFNPREYFDVEKMELLKNSILENGVIVPIRVKMSEDNQIVLIDGERRLTAVMELIEKDGVDIKTIPAINERKQMSRENMLILALTTNSGEKLTVLEEAKSIKKLLDYGMKQSEIAKKLGRSVGTINGRLQMVDSTPVIVEALESGEITQGEARKIVSESDGTKESQQKKLKEVKIKKTIKKTSKKETIGLLESCVEWLIELSNGQELPQVKALIDRINEVVDE